MENFTIAVIVDLSLGTLITCLKLPRRDRSLVLRIAARILFMLAATSAVFFWGSISVIAVVSGVDASKVLIPLAGPLVLLAFSLACYYVADQEDDEYDDDEEGSEDYEAEEWDEDEEEYGEEYAKS